MNLTVTQVKTHSNDYFIKLTVLLAVNSKSSGTTAMGSLFLTNYIVHMTNDLTSQGMLCHTQAQRLKAVVDVWLCHRHLEIYKFNRYFTIRLLESGAIQTVVLKLLPRTLI